MSLFRSIALATLACAATVAGAAPCGDVDGDGRITAADGSVIEAGLLGTATACGGAGIECADVNDNGSLDPGDRILLGRMLAGVELIHAPCTRAPPPIPCGSTIAGIIAADQTWPGEGCVTKLSGLVVVAAPAVLTIRPGAVVQGIVNPLHRAQLFVARGAKLVASGTSFHPIVLTSDQPPGTRHPGDWGGLILAGSAPVNWDTGGGRTEEVREGDPLYGGNNVDDNSGMLRFVRIEFAGGEVALDVPSAALQMNAVGAGTVIDHVQVHASREDGFDWYGGTVRGKYLVATAVEDDDFDWQYGWRGRVQFALAHKRAATLSGVGHNGFEGDNSDFRVDAAPRSDPRICNATVIGPRGQGVPVGVSGSGANVRRGTAGLLSNTLLTGWASACLDIDHDETLGRACTGPGTPRIGADVLRVQHARCYDNGPSGTTQVVGSSANPPCTPSETYELWATAAGLAPPDPTSIGLDSEINPDGGFPATADDRYVPGSPLASLDDCRDLDPGFFESAPYVGAFRHGGPNWLLDAPPCVSGQVAGCWINVAAD